MNVQAFDFDGETFDPLRDGARLGGQLLAVKALMSDGRFRTLRDIAGEVGGSEAGVSARLRDLRKRKFGAHVVNRQRISGGLWAYQLVVNAPTSLFVTEGR